MLLSALSVSTWVEGTVPLGVRELPLGVALVLGGAILAVLLGLLLLAIATATSKNAGVRAEQLRKQTLVFGGPAPVSGSWGALTNLVPGWVPPPLGASAGSRPTSARPL